MCESALSVFHVLDSVRFAFFFFLLLNLALCL
jgi:hypothetical protein